MLGKSVPETTFVAPVSMNSKIEFCYIIKIAAATLEQHMSEIGKALLKWGHTLCSTHTVKVE